MGQDSGGLEGTTSAVAELRVLDFPGISVGVLLLSTDWISGDCAFALAAQPVSRNMKIRTEKKDNFCTMPPYKAFRFSFTMQPCLVAGLDIGIISTRYENLTVVQWRQD